jgi:hypothetical protein
MIMKKLGLILLLLMSVPTLASTFYISASGNDSHGCTNSGADVCLTINRGVAVAAAGDTVSVAAGTYGAQSINQTKSSPGVAVACESSGACTISGALSTSGAWYSLADFTVDVGSAHSTGWSWGGSHITGNNIRVHGPYATVFTGGSSNSWIGGELGASGATPGLRTVGSDTEPVQVGGSDSLTIRGVTFWAQNFNPVGDFHLEIVRIDLVSGNITNFLFERNTVVNNNNANTAVIFITDTTGSTSLTPTLTFRNNFIGDPGVGGNGSFATHANIQNCGGIAVNYNTLLGGFGAWLSSAGSGCSGTRPTFVGNAGSDQPLGCFGTNTKNVVQWGSS